MREAYALQDSGRQVPDILSFLSSLRTFKVVRISKVFEVDDIFI
jgi:hypothetical protein